MHLGESRIENQARKLLQRDALLPDPRRKWQLGHFARATAAVAWLAIVTIACSCITVVEAQRATTSLPSASWSTAVLSVGRLDLAATSLPDHGLAIFAGGYGWGTTCYVCLNAMSIITLIELSIESAYSLKSHTLCSQRYRRSL
jgi:hypothetical protein